MAYEQMMFRPAACEKILLLTEAPMTEIPEEKKHAGMPAMEQ